jgi:hypothetical protein
MFLICSKALHARRLWQFSASRAGAREAIEPVSDTRPKEIGRPGCLPMFSVLAERQRPGVDAIHHLSQRRGE